MASQTIRVFWRNAATGWFNFNWDGVITPRSVVHISASECALSEGGFFDGEHVQRHRGEAPIWVKNIRPHGPNPGDTITGGVEFFLQIDWETPLNVATDIIVLGEPEGYELV
ncbi:MAG: hypothetical protein KDE50_12405 [Caldilineaceae bacterium]|nr:hypothetical protein [Caldilineaceae bacterium]MCB0140700.1 hypothetical protein [Caldilineaceae bacterium]